MFADGGFQRNRRKSWYDKGRVRKPSHREILTAYMNEKIAEERQREHRENMNIKSARLMLMYGQIPLEIEIVSDDDESMTTGEIKSVADFLTEQGFTARTFGSRENNDGEKGTVTSVTPVEGTRMFEVTAKLDNGKEFKWKAFSANEFRKHDRIQVGKNDRGFRTGILIEEPPTQEDLPF